MQFKFDSNNLITPPKIALCKMDLEMLGYLEVNNVVIKPTFCSLTEIGFTVYDGTYLYDSIRRYMVLEVDGFGRFQIEPTEEKDDGLVKYKEVTAYSYEVSLTKYTLSYKDNVQYERRR